MTNSLTQKFGAVKHQPKGEKKLTQDMKLRKTAPLLLAGICFNDDEMKAGDHIPPGVLNDNVTNHIGTICGDGQGGKGGAQLWRIGGRIRRVRENAIIILAVLSDPQIAKFCEEHSLQSPDELYERILGLPSVEGDLEA